MVLFRDDVFELKRRRTVSLPQTAILTAAAGTFSDLVLQSTIHVQPAFTFCGFSERRAFECRMSSRQPSYSNVSISSVSDAERCPFQALAAKSCMRSMSGGANCNFINARAAVGESV